MTALCQPTQTKKGLLLPGLATSFNLAQTLDCGQAFRWVLQPDGGYTGVAMGRRVALTTIEDGILLGGVSMEEFDLLWRPYFDLDRDYAALQADFAHDPVLAEAIGYAPGIRVLRQEPWETVCTFILSANNNIPRIKGIVARLAELLGDPLGDGVFAFPPAQRLAGLAPGALEPLRCGYRAAYLLDAAQAFATGRVTPAMVEALPTDEARALLMTIKGIGPKVADCVLLFAFGRVECFPLDTWMKKVMAAVYPTGLPEGLLPQAGLAQQYLFHYARHHNEQFK